MQRLTVPVVDTFIEDLKECVREAKGQPAGDGTMVAVYGTFPSDFICFFRFDSWFLFPSSRPARCVILCVNDLGRVLSSHFTPYFLPVALY